MYSRKRKMDTEYSLTVTPILPSTALVDDGPDPSPSFDIARKSVRSYPAIVGTHVPDEWPIFHAVDALR